MLVAQLCLTFCDPWTVAHQAPLSMEFSRQEYDSELSFPSPSDLPNPRIELRSPALQEDSLPSEPLGKLSAQFSSVAQSFDFLWPHVLQHSWPPYPSPTPGTCSNSCPLSWWCHLTTSSSFAPFSSCPQSFQHQGLFQWVNSSHQVAKVLDLQLQHQSFQGIFTVHFL